MAYVVYHRTSAYLSFGSLQAVAGHVDGFSAGGIDLVPVSLSGLDRALSHCKYQCERKGTSASIFLDWRDLLEYAQHSLMTRSNHGSTRSQTLNSHSPTPRRCWDAAHYLPNPDVRLWPSVFTSQDPQKSPSRGELCRLCNSIPQTLICSAPQCDRAASSLGQRWHLRQLESCRMHQAESSPN